MTSPLEQLRWNWTHSCETPLMEAVADCAVNINKYFFNKTAGMCERFYWNGCLKRGVYETRYECALSCNPGESAGRCTQTPPMGCSSAALRARRRFLPLARRSGPDYLQPGPSMRHPHKPLTMTRPPTHSTPSLRVKKPHRKPITPTSPIDYNYEFDAYYYDSKTRTCKKYKFCGPQSAPQGSNFFTSMTDCLMECEGFPIVKTN
ncbi:kunitz-type serine protease inhibitor 6-like [Rhipicephalus microplus]|uniref:kunitz-type serine protease inhibitor 6-like n=1 Tax=Rhipicephalus microplus TaxID=6941 RepID=UPI003F6B5052